MKGLTIQEIIRLSRERKQLTQTQLADRLKITNRTLWKIERLPGYIQKVKQKTIKRLCEELDLKPEVFFENEIAAPLVESTASI